jgi:hypothetical protein
VCDVLVATSLNMLEKTKDGSKARQDLIYFGIRKELHGHCDKLETTKGKLVINDHCPPPIMLHSKSKEARASFQVPCSYKVTSSY